jgi:hypothetical protein
MSSIRVRFRGRTANQGFYLTSLLLISILSAGFAGCAGIVSGNSSGTPPPLTIANVQPSKPTTTGFQVSWSTNIAANSSMDYGTSASYGASTPVNSTMVTSHQMAVSGLAIGTLYHFRVRSTDAKNDLAVSSDMTFATAGDTTPPTVSITSPAANATLSGTVNVDMTANDNVGVSSVQLKIDNANFGAAIAAAPYVIAVNTTSLSNGNHILTAVASDAAGNSATSAQVPVKVNNTTNTPPPTVSMTAPTNGATVNGTILVTATAASSVGVASVQFQLDGANFGSLSTTAPYSVSWNTTTSSNGAHTLRAIAKDTAGNSTTSASVTVTVNNTSTAPPTVSITSPASGATVSGTLTVTATAASSVGVASVQFQLDAGNLGSLDTVSPYATSWDTTTANNGSHTLRAIAKDTAGNSTTSAAVTVTVSNVAPPPPPPGSTITSFQLTSPLTGTFPFTVGLGFKKGDAPSGASLSVTNGQVVPKSSWSDGSVKTAIASGRAALVANTPLTVNVLAGGTSGGTAKTCADIQTTAPSASIQLGSIGTVALSSLLASPFRTWVSGPEMVECHYRSAVGADATLQVWFHVRLYADGRMWVRAIVENGLLDVATANKSYVPTVSIGGTTVYNNGGAALSHYAQTRWSAEGWIGGDPQVTPKHNTVYLEASKLLPNYMNQAPSAAVLNGLSQTYTPMGNAGWTTDMGSTGFQNQIGLLPLWDALYATSQADSRAYKAVLTAAKSLNSYAIIWNSKTTHLTPRPSDYPTWTIVGANGGGATSVSAGPLNWDVAHHGSGGYLAYLITGDYYYLETMQDQAAMCFLMDNSANGSGTSRYVVQDRGAAWCYRTLSQYEALAPQSDPIASDYNALLSNSVAALNTYAQQSNMNPLGYILSYDVNTGSYSTTASVLSPWQQHFMIQSIGMGVDIEPLANMTNWKALEAHLDLASVGILGPNGANNYCFTDAYFYNLQVANTVTDPTNWYTNWGSVWTNNHGGGQNTSCGNTLGGASGGDPANASTGYWGNLMPAIAYSVEHGATGASASWSRLTGATNWSTVMNSGFGDVPIWGIVPRSAVSTPPPPTTTVSITAPAAGATVSGTVTVTASASSSAGIAGVQFQLDSANFGAQVKTAPYSISWNTTTSTDGTHFLAAVAQDSQGNLTTSSSVNVTVLNTSSTPPVISAVVASPSTTSAAITWTTDKTATSQVEYGTTTNYGSQSTLDSTLVTVHSVTLSGLTASTVYQFRVHSTDAGGNAAVSSNFSFSTLASGTGIPATLGWYQIPNTQLAPNCPNDSTIHGNTGCTSVISTWSGGAADTKRNRLIIWGGGHTDYYGNEVYEMDFNSLTMSRVTGWTTNPNVSPGTETQSDGRPTSRHTYYNLAYIPNVDKMFSFGGALAGSPSYGSTATWMFDQSTLTWARKNPTGGPPNGQPGLTVTVYDPNTSLVFVEDLSNLWSYDYSTNAYTQLGPVNGVDYHQSGVIDPTRKLLFLIGGPGQFWAINIAPGSNYALQDWSSQVAGCSALSNAAYPGLAFDSKQNLVVGWAGGNTAYQFNPDTKKCTAVTYPGGPGGQQPNGTNGRFAYLPLLNLFVVVNDWQQNAYSLRLTQ